MHQEGPIKILRETLNGHEKGVKLLPMTEIGSLKPPMWEYKIEVIPGLPEAAVTCLNDLGREGWELVHTHQMLARTSALSQQQIPALYCILRRFRESLDEEPMNTSESGCSAGMNQEAEETDKPSIILPG